MIDRLEKKATLDPEQIAERRKAMDDDVWLFIKWVCGHGAEDIERHHRPLAYLVAGDAVRLAASLEVYESEIVNQIRADLTKREINWRTKQGIRDLERVLDRVNDRMSRSVGKTTIGLDVMAWLGSVNPNRNIGIASKSDDAAFAMCESIGNVMRSEEYKIYYSDRLYPVNPESYITKKWIRMNGRTETRQDTIEARGINSQWYSKHYHVIYGDDLSSTEAKQGEATVEDEIRWLASLHGISIAERWGGTRYVFNGTISGAKDGHSVLSSDGAYISLVIPIWTTKHGGPWTVQNMGEDGVPVFPELYDEEACKTKRKDTLAKDRRGSIAWLQDFLMCAHELGSMQFTADLIAKSKFVWVAERAKNQKNEIVTKRIIRRYLWATDAKGNVIPKKDTKVPEGPCLCWLKTCQGQHAYKEFDPLDLPRMMAADQAISDKKTADKWSVACVAMDPDGYKYAFKGLSGQGYPKFIAAIPVVFNRWGGRLNPPRKVGIESNAWQATTALWLQRSGDFAFLARRIEKISPGQMAKDLRIFNNVLAEMEMGMLLLDPEDMARDDEMLRYNASSENPEDDILDSISMAVTLHKQPGGDPKDDYAESYRAALVRDCDPYTGVDLSTDFMESMWN